MQPLSTDTLKPLELTPLSTQPLVSVLVPNYNYSRYIGETLDSALRQTYPHFEVIVCDDGSKDNSCEIIETYVQKDSRIKLIRKPNGGVASALNVAYQESKGEIICLLDADDIWLENKLQKTVEIFQSNSRFGFAIHNVIQIDAAGNYIKPAPMYNQLPSGWMGVSALENGGFVDNIPPASALSIRREVAEYIFPLNLEFVRNADSLVFRFAPFITHIGSIMNVLSQFRIHGANTSSVTTATPEFMERELVTIANVHQEQKNFLARTYSASVAASLTDLDSSIIVSHARYLLSRLRRKSKLERQNSHQRLVHHPYFRTQFNRFLQQQLLRWGELLPNPVFDFLYDQVYGTGQIKLLMRKALRARLAFSGASK